MVDGSFPDRVAQLRSRWESDPSSRIFLQLAEEYRHQGRVKEALEVLDRGLKEHPGYLSALVAKGRCHLELNEPETARSVLERVVKQDATQMVANKLLVRAHLDTGEADKARERLDLYSLLNDSDPEIDGLRRRIRSMEQPPQVEKPAPQPPAAPTRPAGEDIFDLGFPAAPPSRAPGDDLFGFVPSAPAAAPPVPVPEPPAAAAPVPVPVEEEMEEETAAPGNDLFPEVAARAGRQRYLSGLAAEGLFAFEDLPAAQPVPPAPEAEPEPWAFEPEPEPVALELEPVELEPEPVALEPEPEPEPIETATLGELYLRQGHHEEAERIFQEVLRREPDNPAARTGLEKLAAPEELAPEPPPAPASVNARKAALLNSYLKRIRRGSLRDVS
jgi:tetratricopeptide (TPR) repeat protein